jgi:hypothetical protein
VEIQGLGIELEIDIEEEGKRNPLYFVIAFIFEKCPNLNSQMHNLQNCPKILY